MEKLVNFKKRKDLPTIYRGTMPLSQYKAHLTHWIHRREKYEADAKERMMRAVRTARMHRNILRELEAERQGRVVRFNIQEKIVSYKASRIEFHNKALEKRAYARQIKEDIEILRRDRAALDSQRTRAKRKQLYAIQNRIE